MRKRGARCTRTPKTTYFTVKDSAMAPRPTHRNTKGICAFTPARERNPTGPQSHPKLISPKVRYY